MRIYADLVLRFERTVRRVREQVLFDAQGNVGLWTRGMAAGVVNRVLQWVQETEC